MAKENSFDIVSEVNLQEVDNAVNISLKEIRNRYDLKNSGSKVEFDRNKPQLSILAPDEYTLKSVYQVVESKAIRRGISPKAFRLGKIINAFSGQVKQDIDIIHGIPEDKKKFVVKKIKSSGLKVKTKIEGDKIRIFGKSKDSLQDVIKLVKEMNLDIPLQFINYR